MKNVLSTIGLFLLTMAAYAEPIELNERYANIYTSTPGCAADITYNFANVENLTSARLYISTSAQNTPAISDITALPSVIGVNGIIETTENDFVDIPLTGELTLTLKDRLCGKDGANVDVPYELMLTKVATNQVTVTGIVTDNAKLPVVGAVVSFYDTSGRFVASAKSNDTGSYSLNVAKGLYNIAVAKGSVVTWYTGGLRTSATNVKIIANYKRNLTIHPTSPHVDSVSTNTLVKDVLLTINGTNFGDVTGDIDFNGYVTGTATYVMSWADDAITVKVPSGAIPGCLRVVNKYAGPSNCIEMQ
jgi:hypothetical protein